MSDLPNPNEIVDKILNVAKAALPETVGQDFKENIRAVIQDVISELDVVSREEFDIQKNVLMKTRSKLDKLEALLDERIDKN